MKLERPDFIAGLHLGTELLLLDFEIWALQLLSNSVGIN